MRLTITVVDAFTGQLFRGNPAAVILLESWLADEKMQAIATENNLSETAFAVRGDEGRYQIRWFSPLKEIDFCGHATLATAFVLFGQAPALSNVGFYAAAVGNLDVVKKPDGWIEMTFPNRAPEPLSEVPEALLHGLSLPPSEVWRNQQAYFAVYTSEDEITTVIQDAERLKQLAPFDVVVTAPGKHVDFVSRYFWPANGGDEDPVTGSIHAGLAPFWAKRLDKSHLLAHQVSQRGGELKCEVEGTCVRISGQAVKYLSGIIDI